MALIRSRGKLGQAAPILEPALFYLEAISVSFY